MKKYVLLTVFVFTAAGSGLVNAEDSSMQTKPASGQTKNSNPSNAADVADPTSKGPKGETVYVNKQGGRYYYSADHRKIAMEVKVDKSLKGPKGETVYIEPGGKKYYVNSAGVKTYLNHDNTIDKPASDKKGTIRKADTQPAVK
jgi:hypothetical protein